MFAIRAVAAALSVALLLQPVDSSAAVFRFDVDGTVASALTGTSIVAGTSFEVTAFLDTSSLSTSSNPGISAQFIGAVTFAPITIGGFTQTPVGSGYVNTSTTSLFMNAFVDGTDAPFAPLGGIPLVRIFLSGLSLPNPSDMSSLTLADLLAATLTANLHNNNNPVQGVSINISSATISEVPIPAALPLFATGLGALLLIARRRNRDKHTSV